MERTFEELYTELVSETGDDSATKLIAFKRWLNRGLSTFQSKLKITYTEQKRLASTVIDQRQYQTPEDAGRIKTIDFDDGSNTLPLSEIIDDAMWQRMYSTAVTGIPTHFHKVGEDLYELYPTPEAVYDDGIILTCRIKQKQMSAANYATGTASIAENGRIVTGVGTTWTAAMVGRRFRFADGFGNGIWYRISGFTSATSITLENYYSDAAVAASGYLIAEIPELPVKLHDALYDYAYWRWLLGKREMGAAREMKGIWEDAIDGYQPEDDTEDQVIAPQPEPYLDDYVMQNPDTAIA